MANEKILNTRLKLKIDTLANWTSNNPVLLKGEVALAEVSVAQEGVANYVPSVMAKVGDGTHTFNDLAWLYSRASDVASWAKAANKPVYTAEEITGLAGFISSQVQDTDTQYQIVKVDNYNYKLQSKSLNGDWVDVENGAIAIPKYDDTAIKADITELQGLVGETAVATQIANAIANLKLEDTYAAKVHSHEISDVTGLSDAIAEAKKAGTDANSALETYKTANDAALAGVKATAEAAYVKPETGIDKTDLASDVQASLNKADTAIQEHQDISHLATKTEAQGYADAKDTAIAAAKKAGDDAQADVDALEAKVGIVPDGKTVVQMIADAQDEATYDDTALTARVAANEGAIATLNGDENTAGSVKKQVADAVAKIVADAPEAYDTLKEISDWISSHASDASAMNSQINTNKTDIANLKALVGTLPESAEATTVVGYIDEAIVALKIGDYAKAADLTAAIGRISTAEGKITVLEGKVSALEAVGAQANVIETVKVNGVALTPDAAKAVDVSVPTGALASKDKVAEADLEDALATKINGKADQTTVTALDGRVTTLEGKAHTHANKALLDTYTQTEVDLADAVAKKHEHANQAELDKIAEGDKAKWDAAVQTVTAGTGLKATKTGTDVAVDIDDTVVFIFDCGTSDIDNYSVNTASNEAGGETAII